jgi:hypothetical protein
MTKDLKEIFEKLHKFLENPDNESEFFYDFLGQSSISGEAFKSILNKHNLGFTAKQLTIAAKVFDDN